MFIFFSQQSKKAKRKLEAVGSPAHRMLMLVSECKRLLGLARQKKLQKRLENPQLLPIAQSGHYLFTDNPQERLKAVDPFLIHSP